MNLFHFIRQNPVNIAFTVTPAASPFLRYRFPTFPSSYTSFAYSLLFLPSYPYAFLCLLLYHLHLIKHPLFLDFLLHLHTFFLNLPIVDVLNLPLLYHSYTSYTFVSYMSSYSATFCSFFLRLLWRVDTLSYTFLPSSFVPQHLHNTHLFILPPRPHARN